MKEQNNGNESKQARKHRLRAQADEICGRCKHIEFILPIQLPPVPGAVVGGNRVMSLVCCANPDSEHFMQMLNVRFGCAQFERREELKKVKLVGVEGRV